MTTLNLQTTVNRFAAPLTRVRFGANTFDGGYPGSPSSMSATIRGYTSSDGKSKDIFPESIRQSIDQVLYTNDDVAGPDQQTGIKGDNIIYGGDTYSVMQVTNNPLQGKYNIAALKRLGTVP